MKNYTDPSLSTKVVNGHRKHELLDLGKWQLIRTSVRVPVVESPTKGATSYWGRTGIVFVWSFYQKSIFMVLVWSLGGPASHDSASLIVLFHSFWAVLGLGLVVWVDSLHCLHHFPAYSSATATSGTDTRIISETTLRYFTTSLHHEWTCRSCRRWSDTFSWTNKGYKSNWMELTCMLVPRRNCWIPSSQTKAEFSVNSCNRDRKNIYFLSSCPLWKKHTGSLFHNHTAEEACRSACGECQEFRAHSNSIGSGYYKQGNCKGMYHQ